MTTTNANIKFNVTGAKRKELVSLISNFTGCPAKYNGAPTFAYEVDYFTIDKNGTLIFDDRADSEVIERLLEMLYDNSFVAEETETVEQSETLTETDGCEIEVQLPKTDFSESTVDNLKKLIAAKGNLIKEALGTQSLEIKDYEDRIGFPWFSTETDSEDLKAYQAFLAALTKLATEQKRINAKEAEVDNKKYAFRCFLLRLGFIGTEYKATRKILLRNLEGSSAFKSGKKNEVQDNG